MSYFCKDFVIHLEKLSPFFINLKKIGKIQNQRSRLQKNYCIILSEKNRKAVLF